MTMILDRTYKCAWSWDASRTGMKPSTKPMWRWTWPLTMTLQDHILTLTDHTLFVSTLKSVVHYKDTIIHILLWWTNALCLSSWWPWLFRGRHLDLRWCAMCRRWHQRNRLPRAFKRKPLHVMNSNIHSISLYLIVWCVNLLVHYAHKWLSWGSLCATVWYILPCERIWDKTVAINLT